MSEKLPVVLVHGYLASQSLMLPLKGRLSKAGFSAHTVDLPFLNLADVRRCSEVMKEGVEELLGRLGHDRCDLLGVSLGGLMTLYYIKRLGGETRVRRMIALGTPFKGSWASLVAVATLGLISRAARQTMPGSRFLGELNRGALPEGVECYSIFATGDPISPPERSVLEGASNIEVKSVPLPFTHQGLIFVPSVFRSIVEILEKP